jgi:hypothetical protein
MMKEHGIVIGQGETMDQSAQDMSAQLAKIKATDSETVIITAADEVAQSRALAGDDVREPRGVGGHGAVGWRRQGRSGVHGG